MINLRTVRALTVRAIKLLIYYAVTSPFFAARICYGTKESQLSHFDKICLILVGEVWIFGKNKIDLRRAYETQRECLASDFGSHDLLVYMPGQWYTLSPLESALTILMAPKICTLNQKLLLTPYKIFVFLFNESKHDIKGNHGIASALALSCTVAASKPLSRRYYSVAVKILRENSNMFFYDEGSTNYHIFVTTLFKLYFRSLGATASWFRGYEKIAHLLIESKAFFFFGDDDRSHWLYKNGHTDTNEDGKRISISTLLSDVIFKKSVIDLYFKTYTRGSSTLFVCSRGSSWGHAHYMVGSILYYLEDRGVVLFKKNSFYTLSYAARQTDRLQCCNSPLLSSTNAEVKICFFKELPKPLVHPVRYEEFDNQIAITGAGWTRVVSLYEDNVSVEDSAYEGDPVMAPALRSSRFVKYRLLNHQKMPVSGSVDCTERALLENE